MKYKLQQIVNAQEVLTYEFDATTLEEMLLKFRYFLAGCSFVIRPEEEIILDDSRLYQPSISMGKKNRK